MQQIKMMGQRLLQFGRKLLFIPFFIFVALPSTLLMQIFPTLRRQLQSVARFSSSPAWDGLDGEFEFLQKVLRAVAKDPRPQSVGPVLQANLDCLDEAFGEQLRTWGTEAISRAEVEDASDIAAIIVNLGNRIQELKEGDGSADLTVRAAPLEISILAYDTALTFYTEADFPKQWAMTHYNLGNAYRQRANGDRAENLQKAIAAYKLALQVFKGKEYIKEQQLVQHHLDNLEREPLQAAPSEKLEEVIST